MRATLLAIAASSCVSLGLAALTDQHTFSAGSLLPSLGSHVHTSHDGVYEHVSVPSLPEYNIRIKQVENLCDPSVKQYAGYLDVSKHKHLFFWFFESRKDPHKAPLAAWMNGGPGGSSALGLLMENGPCNVQPKNETKRNPYAWNEVTNMFYLDQPAGVGYSYSTSSHLVDTTKEAAKDFYAFVQLFLTRFPEYSERPFHVMAESYGGQYAPNFANYINRQNKAQALVPSHRHVNLESVVIVNGMVSVGVQTEMDPEYGCRGPYAFWDNNGEHCALLRSRVPRLRQLMQMCRDFQTPLTCIPAGIYAFSALNDGFERLGRNRYDVRRNCNDPVVCYDEMNWAQSYLNSTAIKSALGVTKDYDYSWLNMDINAAFVRSADISNDATPMIRELVEDGVRVLNLAGDADFACNFMGAFEWMYQLDNPYAKEFRAMNNTIWKNSNSKAVGEVRAAGADGGKTAGRYTWLRVYEAGHMVPHDQPEVSLEFFEKWINNEPIA
ncbi:Serine carboxypeptidase [Ceratobasidium sp. AG-Ba]|nr:Serine carboxypeptidase [Ceratobasidium sp. AG-Ba]